jgi:SAM-dependent methyltransferase
MIGQHTAQLETAPRRWIQGMWGCPEIHTRQKWSALWPHLSALPEHGVRLLDAGCGTGRWSLELAARRPQWSVVGIDVDDGALRQAESAKARLGLTNVSFVRSDLRTFDPPKRFNVVLSVFSLHYLIAAGEASAMFDRFAQWLTPEGRLMILAPRRAEAALFVRGLPRPDYQGISSAPELATLCDRAGLRVVHLGGVVGRLGVLAKQLNLAVGGWRPLVVATYPVQWVLASLDVPGRNDADRLMLMWVLVARRAPDDSFATGSRP